MAIDIVKLLAIVAGFTMIIAATVLALRQSITWQHVVVFCLGGVLAGISGVQLQGSGTNWSATIGEVKNVAENTNEATVQLVNAVAALKDRVDDLQTSVQRISAAGGRGPAPPPQLPTAEINRALEQSRALSARASELSRRLVVPTR
jgi:hypothetical protein